jgi:alpha-tubulin suppressor-like RCC1 family protein/serine/threonine protein kinase
MSAHHQLVFYTGPREAVHLANLIASGGEGGVYNVFEYPDQVAKIFHPRQRTAAIAEKLQVMLQFRPAEDVNAHRHHVLIAWPTQIIYKTPSAQTSYTSANGTENLVVGYLMPKLNHTYAIAQLLNPNFRIKHHPELNHRHIYRVAINLVRIVSQLHSNGIVIGDINEKNFHFTKELDRVALVSIIDCDSMQITSPMGEIFPCNVVVPEYTAPELHGKDIRKGVVRTEQHDLFGLAVLLYKLLMQGFHPFQGIPSAGMPQVESAQVWCIKNNVFPHIANSFYGPPRYAPRITSLPPTLITLFLRAFLKGYARPTAVEWEAALTHLEQTLVPCSNDSSHIHPADCPCVVCEWEYANGKRTTGGLIVPGELADMPLPPLMRTSDITAPSPITPSVWPAPEPTLRENDPIDPPAEAPAERPIPRSVWSTPISTPDPTPSSQSTPLATHPPAAPSQAGAIPDPTPTPAAAPLPVQPAPSPSEPIPTSLPTAPSVVSAPLTPDAEEPATPPSIKPSLWSTPLPGMSSISNPIPVTRTTSVSAPIPVQPIPEQPLIPPVPSSVPLAVPLAAVPDQSLLFGQTNPTPEQAPAPLPVEQPPVRSQETQALDTQAIAAAVANSASYVTDTLDVVDDNLPAAPAVPRSLWSTPLRTNEATRVPVEAGDPNAIPLPYDPYRQPQPTPDTTASASTPVQSPPIPEPIVEPNAPPTTASRSLWSSPLQAGEATRVPKEAGSDPAASPRTQYLAPLDDNLPPAVPPPTPVDSGMAGGSMWSTPLQAGEATRVPVESGSGTTRPFGRGADAIPIMTGRPDPTAPPRPTDAPDGTSTPVVRGPIVIRTAPTFACGAQHMVAVRGDGTVWSHSEPAITALQVPSGLAGVIAVAAGQQHTLALRYDGTVVAWGMNGLGQTNVPAGLNNVVAIAAGGAFSLALQRDGHIVAWGDDQSLQCQVPPSLGTVTQIAAGTTHAMALCADGTVTEWGQLDRDALLDARGVSGVAAIAAHDGVSIALTSQGEVLCWGKNAGATRAAVRQLPPICHIAAGKQTIVAVDTVGTIHVVSPHAATPGFRADAPAVVGATDSAVVVCADDSVTLVGPNTTRSVAFQSAHVLRIGAGIRGTTDRGLALQQLAQRATPSIAAGYEHTVGITADGQTLSWGDNTYGQRAAPAQPLMAVAAGGWHALGYDADGRIHAWGRSNHGQTVFATVSKFRAVGVAAGMVHSLAVGDEGRILAWGNNDEGQCSVPDVRVPGLAVAAGMRHSVVLLADGSVRAWGNNSASQTVVPATLTDVIAVAAGGQSSAALKSDGSVVVWGELAVRAQNVAHLRDVVAISLGGEHGVVLRANGQLEFFGNDDYGQCTLPRNLPRIIAVACGTLHTVVVAESGQMYAWGRDSYQQTHVPDGVLFRR